MDEKHHTAGPETLCIEDTVTVIERHTINRDGRSSTSSITGPDGDPVDAVPRFLAERIWKQFAIDVRRRGISVIDPDDQEMDGG